MAEWKAKADPTKEFFIDMITRDIGLDECMFDLLDNSIDGAAKQSGPDANGVVSLDGYSADISVHKDKFSIYDNCGGISLSDATEYAFHFGRRHDAPKDSERSIGLYGIGMKRAVFKIGKKINIKSSTKSKPEEAFETTIDVPEWAAAKDWDFTLKQLMAPNFVGTKIDVTELNEGASSEFSDSVFTNNLIADIGRYYSFFINDGFRINVNGNEVPSHIYGVKGGGEFEPYIDQYIDSETGVMVKVISGLAGSPPDDASDTSSTRGTDNWGWFVVCNNRVVLAGNKTDQTVWGENLFPGWHPQYNGFMGIVFFSSDDPRKLPWTTTKRQIDDTLPVYRRAVIKMKEATRPFLDYTNQRKTSLDAAKTKEDGAKVIKIDGVQVADLKPQSAPMKVPLFAAKPKVQMASIAYQRPVSEVKKVAEALGNSQLSYKQIGIETFEYFLNNEVDE